MLSMKGWGECETVGEGGTQWETKVLIRCNMKAGLRMIAGRR